MRTPEQLLALIETSSTLKAALWLIRVAEGTSGQYGWYTYYGGAFETVNPGPHPRRKVTSGKYTSTAFGAFQFLAGTWDEVIAKYNLPDDMDPVNQQIAACAYMEMRGCLDPILNANFYSWCSCANTIWASLPGSPYGQPTIDMERAVAIYREAGGYIADEIEKPADQPAKETPVIPAIPIAATILQAALPLLKEVAPQLVRLFSNSPTGERNAQALELVANAAIAATGAPNVQAAVEQISSAPPAQEKFRAEVQKVAPAITQALDLERKAAREFAMQYGSAPTNRPLEVVTYSIIGLFALIVIVVLVWRFDRDLATMVIQAAIAFAGGVVGFWVGSSYGSRTKDYGRGPDLRG